jgi:hypothetical protein
MELKGGARSLMKTNSNLSLPIHLSVDFHHIITDIKELMK